MTHHGKVLCLFFLALGSLNSWAECDVEAGKSSSISVLPAIRWNPGFS